MFSCHSASCCACDSPRGLSGRWRRVGICAIRHNRTSRQLNRKRKRRRNGRRWKRLTCLFFLLILLLFVRFVFVLLCAAPYRPLGNASHRKLTGIRPLHCCSILFHSQLVGVLFSFGNANRRLRSNLRGRCANQVALSNGSDKAWKQKHTGRQENVLMGGNQDAEPFKLLHFMPVRVSLFSPSPSPERTSQLRANFF